MKKFLIATLLCMALTVTMVPMAFAADSNYTECMAAIQEQRTIQDQAHQTAESLRKKGYSDSSAYVQAAKSTWNEAQKAIAGYQKLAQYSDEAQVVLNRVEDSRFPDTVKGVITQPGQYSTKYATVEAANAIQATDSKNGTYYYGICEDSVKAAMMGQVEMPSNVLYQANFSQGKGVWKSVYFNSGWYASTSYFCYG